MERHTQKIREKRKKKQQYYSNFHAKEEHFIRNRALLLEKQVSLFQGKELGCEPCKVFSAKDIKRATVNYDRQRIISSKIATVFKGDIDGRSVIIKTMVPELATEYPRGLPGTSWLIDFFLNQIAIKQVINHKNFVALHGCWLETLVPILVLEYEETLKVNEKCDVYGFGVLLVEMLMGYDPLELMLNGEAKLGDRFRLAMVENNALEIIDRKVLEEAKDGDIQQLSKVALRCIGKGVDRPTLPEVASELRHI